MNVLIACNSGNRTPFSEFIPLAIELKKHECTVNFVLDRHPSEKIARKIRSEGLTYETVSNKGPEPIRSQQTKSQKTEVASRIKRFEKFRVYLSQIYTFIRLTIAFYNATKAAAEIVKHHSPDVLIVYGDRTIGVVPPIIKAVRHEGVPVVDLQLAVSDEEFLYNSVRKNNFYYNTENYFNRIFCFFNPSHAKKFNDETVLFYPWAVGTVLKIQGMLPKNPWYIGQSWASRVLLLSNKEKIRHLKNGGAALRAEICGQFSHDRLYKSFCNRDQIRARLTEKYFQQANKNLDILIIALPQFAEHRLMGWAEAKAAHAEIIEQVTTGDKKNILISLHPKMELPHYLDLEKNYTSVKLLRDERLADVLPAASIYVTAFESTVPWAIMCGVSSIFLDYFDLGFDVSEYQSVRPVKKSFEISHAIADLKIDAMRMEDFEADKRLLPPFDGASFTRIFSALKCLTAES